MRKRIVTNRIGGKPMVFKRCDCDQIFLPGGVPLSGMVVLGRQRACPSIRHAASNDRQLLVDVQP